MSIPNRDDIVDRLCALQVGIRDLIIQSRGSQNLHSVSRDSSADTIYALDTVVEPALVEFCNDWARTAPLVLISEGLENEHGPEGIRVFPEGAREEDAAIRVIVDPVDGTRGLMYDKRSAWALAGVAPNKGPGTSLRDIEVAVMTELPTSKMGFGDVLWAVKGQGAQGKRVDLRNGDSQPLLIRPSVADNIDHGFAAVSSFFPGTKVLAAELIERIAEALTGKLDITRATVFDDQYISTGGQLYELIVGHDRFICDLRSEFYRMQGYDEGLCVHPYDLASWLIAEEAGVILTDGRGHPLDGPLDVTTGISWAGFANEQLRGRIEPIVIEFLNRR